MAIYEIVGNIIFIPSLFILSMFLAFFFSKRIVRKILFLEFDENLKILAHRDFFLQYFKNGKINKIFLFGRNFIFNS